MKQTIRLTESDLRRIVKESVKKMLREQEDYNWERFEEDPEETKRWENQLSWRNKEEVDNRDRITSKDFSQLSDDEWEDRNRYQKLDMTGKGKRNPKASWDVGYKGKFKSPDEGCDFTDATFDAEGQLKDYNRHDLHHNWVR